MLTSIKRSFILGWKNFKRSGGLSVVAIMVLMVTTFLATSLLLAQEVMEETIEEVERRADITIYFTSITPGDRIMEVAENIDDNFTLLGIDYTSQHEALEDFRQRHGDNPVLMDALDEVGNIFNPRLDVRATEVETYRRVSDYVRGNYSEIVEEISFYSYGRKEAIESIFSITSRIRRALIVAGTILAVISVLIVFGTIRLSIYSFSEEIKIMKLVGASNAFMQGSFIVQGFILGLVASLISLLVLFGLAGLMYQGYNVFGINLENHLFENLSLILILQFSTGIGLSVISSALAVKRYLDV